MVVDGHGGCVSVCQWQFEKTVCLSNGDLQHPRINASRSSLKSLKSISY